MNAKALREAAHAVRLATAGRDDHEVTRLLIIAADLDRAADASNGYGSIETYHVALVLDNDHGLYDRRCEMVREHLEAYYSPEEGGNLREMVSYLADALRDWCRELCGLEGEDELPMLARELLGCAIPAVEWIELAKGYVAEELQA